MSSYRDHPSNDNMGMLCSLRDASLGNIKKKYTRTCKLRFWARLPTKDNAQLIVQRGKARWSHRYNSDPACWVGGVVPDGPV